MAERGRHKQRDTPNRAQERKDRAPHSTQRRQHAHPNATRLYRAPSEVRIS